MLVLAAECWMTVGQICFKKSTNRLNLEDANNREKVVTGTTFSKKKSCLSLLFYPILWLGGSAMVVGLLFWFAALSSGELNYVYLLGSTQYILALVAAHYFLHERINTAKFIGTLLIMLGVILTALS